VIACSLAAAAFTLLGDLKDVAATTDVAIYLVFLATNATVILLRFKLPNAERPFRTPIAIGRFPVVPVLAILATLLMMSQLDGVPLVSMAALGGIGMLLFGSLSIIRGRR
jgi:APA family basic amino acid/polyamine antiporter